MAIPDDIASPYVTSARRYLWLAQKERARTLDDGPSLAFRVRRLAASGTALPSTFPSRSVLLAAGVLAVEEVVGARVPELLSYGLTTAAAERLILWLERRTMDTFNCGPRIGQLYEADEIELIASGTRTASFTSDIYETGDRGTLRLALALAAISGSGARLHAQIETRDAYASGTWRVVDAFGPLTAAATVNRSMSGLNRFVRVVCTLEGTSPSVTFALTGTAV